MTEVQDRGRRFFFAIFTISGFSGLIYESIWSHYLKLFLGHAAYSQTLVLAIFMGGMAIGSWLMAKNSSRVLNLLLGYAIVEGVIGLLGLVFHKTSIGVTGWAFDVLLPSLGSPFLVQVSKWTLGALMILPQSILLGTTFPLMSGAIVRRYPQRAGETLAMLYFTNSLGAALGVMVSGFYLIGKVGLPGTILTAGLLNIALAVVVWGIVKKMPGSVQPAAPATQESSSTATSAVLRWMLVGAAVTGAAAFLYEIAWIRMLSLVLGSTTHSFELMLSAFILGIALGGLWVRRRIDNLSDPIRFLGKVLLIMATVALLSLPVYNVTFDMMSTAVKLFTGTREGYVGYHVISHAIAMLVMIPTTFFCGMTLPIMTHILIRTGTGERAIGAVYAWNTAGAIAGVVLAVHVLMPLVGVKGVVVAGAALHLALGIAYLSLRSQPVPSFSLARWPLAIGLAGLTAAIALFHLDPFKLTSGVFRHGSVDRTADTKILYLKDGKTATISLIDVGGLVSIATNGKPDAAINMTSELAGQDEITMTMAGALPIALHPHPERIANIGIGSGLTSQVLLASDTVRELDTIEIEPFMAHAAKLGFTPRVARTFEDPRSRIYFEDAKTFFAVHKKKYDVIVSEPSNPWVSGVSSLFSEEFYAQVTHHLEPDGMLVQWIQTYETNLDIVLSVMKALAPHFEDFAIYSADDTNLLIVASRAGTLPRPHERLFASAAMRAQLDRVGIQSMQHIEQRYLGDKRLYMPLLATSRVPANSDYFPYIDLNAPRARIMKQAATEVSGIATLGVPFFDLLGAGMRSEERTVFSPNSNSSRDQLIGQSTALRDAWESSSYGHLLPEAARSFATLYSPKEQCRDAGIRRAWLDSVFDISVKTNTALSATELKVLWAKVLAAPCVGELAADERELLTLLHAVAMRDAPVIAQSGANLFASNPSFLAHYRTFALIATSAAQLATNNPEDAMALLSKQLNHRRHPPAETLALRWLVSMSMARTTREGVQPAE